ncbi:MAG: bifunctional 5,10-methylenetetrahydrofolate dehydrogenase/5,10-methenyltetrahydrofolate cyclohydrolase [Proteobacteria bacterium]|nr:bifunctional 5,10-methylenetetrahydrofolate dehydrogenase/5,10-methenyltetrahydrofolate cyclohydrolase [Pseudomonadota bacterium]NDC23234.1 bifunctional 5,10-methylenetetrahydrofolate dehydrogenase/5,10-methenyltetrahydrofolate cyclohydrolase [Pseudomonadota bacterium]NDD04124.1 bifunctional 5,10-methylenetetrahydrofolate dehydrogenase/5,10-methenyltetrahydrofolate cyclohydrolase [Pseudomonadota bacterium]NDG26823.1 bifunctional 5,10-methylenetetrahydrofolate dehydrogenase/5,10-methenyltetrah
MAIHLNGKKVAEELYSKLLLEVSLLPIVPKLAVILVGSDPASQTYVKTKEKKCLSLGLQSETFTYSQDVTESELIEKIKKLNEDKSVHGVLIQLPLPAHINKNRLMEYLSPLKDVDGLTPDNAGRLAQGIPRLIPCTPHGIMALLSFYGIPIEGKRVVVLGRSDIVGKPMAQLMINANATVTVCHSKTKEIKEICQTADILVAAIGKPKWLGPDFVKSSCSVIDVGIHREGETFCGDVDFEEVEKKCHAITPVPGGVGPMTIALLMKNLVLAASLQSKPGRRP